MKYLMLIFIMFGIMTVVYGIVGLIIDISTFDNTKGGYEYPLKVGLENQ